MTEEGLVPFEILHRTLMALGGGAAGEGAKIAAAPGLRVLLARIETILAGRELADHGDITFSEGILAEINILPATGSAAAG
jgi:hypothetical protein